MRILKKHAYLICLLSISLISHWYVFLDTGVLNSGDWVYHFNSQSRTVFGFAAYISSFNLGVVNAFPNNWPFYALFYLTSLVGGSWDLFTRLFFLIPIIFLTPTFSFLLFRRILRNDLAAFVGACLYSFNTIFLKLQLDWITYAFIWWVLPALFLSTLSYLKTKENRYLIYNALLVFLGIAYEIRVMLLVIIYVTIFLAVYFIFQNEPIRTRMKTLAYVLASVVTGILGHAFWLIPMKLGKLQGDIMSWASPTPFVSFYNVLDNLTLHMYSWSHNLVLEPFIRQPIDLRHFLIPLVAILGIIVYKNIYTERGRRTYFIFFSITLVVFIFLGKQTFAPFGELYSWAFSKIPLFNLYRESSKFILLSALSISFFFAVGSMFLYRVVEKHNKALAGLVLGILVLTSSVFNLQHFVDQKIGMMTTGRLVPKDYKVLEAKLSKDNNYYRVLWLPRASRFGFYSEQHPFLNMTDLTGILKDRTNLNLFDNQFPIGAQLAYLLNQPYSSQLIDDLSVRYVIVPISEIREKRTQISNVERTVEIFEDYGTRQYFINQLDKQKYLHRVNIGTKDLVVYENKDYKPHIVSDNVSVKSSSPTEYEISIKSLDGAQPLFFSESFNKAWKLYLRPVKQKGSGGVNKTREISYLVQKSVFDKQHYKANGYANGWTIDGKSIKKGFSKDYYRQRPDGSIDVNMVIYFRPQSYFYLGLIVSSVTLLGCLGYLIWDWRKRRRAFVRKLSGPIAPDQPAPS